MPVNVTITTETKSLLHCKPKTAGNNDTTVDGPPIWQSSDNTIAFISPNPADPSGLSAFICGRNPGTVVVTVTADADRSPAVRNIKQVADVTVNLAEASYLELIVEPPVLQ